MLGKYTEQNIKAIWAKKPSLLVHKEVDNKGIKSLSVSLYIDLKSELVEHECIAFTEVTKMPYMVEGKNVYSITGTVGAYPGFGSLIYQSIMIEIFKADPYSLFISDREYIEKDSLNIYAKIANSIEFFAVELPLSHPSYTNKVTGANLSHINKGYIWVNADKTLDFHQQLINNHTSRNISTDSKENILEMGRFVGEWVSDKKTKLTKNMKDGFSLLLSDSEHALEFMED